MKSYQKIELVGMCLVLLSFAWQFFIDRQHDSVLKDWQYEHIETRLDEIHQRQFELQQNQNALAEQLANREKTGAKFVGNYKNATSHRTGSEELKERSGSFKYVGVSMFIFGSIFLMAGKLVEHNLQNA